MYKISTRNILIIILAATLLIRLLGFGQALYTDEAHYANIQAYFGSQYYIEHGLNAMQKGLSDQYFAEKFNTNPSISHHPPLSMALWAVSTFVFGDNTFAFRLVPLMFGIISIFLIYLLAKEMYGEKAGIISAAIAALAFYHILASLLVDVHGAIQFTFFIAAVYFFVKHEKTGKTRELIYSGALAGVALLNAYTGAFLFVMLSVYSLIKDRKVITTAKTIIKLSAVAAAVYSLFPIASFIFNKDLFLRTLLGAGILDLNINLRFLVFLFIWVGPLLLGLAALSLLRKKKEDLLFWVWIVVAALFNIFSYPNASLDRYFMVAIPAFIILAGRFLSEANLKSRHIYAGGIIFLAFYTFLLFLNLDKVQYLGHDLGSYISLASSLKWNFFFPITGPVGPTFGVSFSSIAYSLLISGIFAFAAATFVILKRPRLAKWALTIFIATSLAFNFLLVEEYLVHATHPNMSKTYYESVDYYEGMQQQDTLMPDKVYTNNRALFFYLDKTGLNLFSYTEETDQSTKQLIEQGNLTVMLFNFPKIPEDEPIWQYLNSCKLEKTFYDKGQETGYVYVC